jgi:hypothetical protein
MRAVRLLLLLAGDDNGGGDDVHRQQGSRDHDRLLAPHPMGVERLGRRTLTSGLQAGHARHWDHRCRTGGRVARQLNGCSPSTVYIEELLDERAAALLPLGGTETFLGEPRMRDIETIDGELRLLAREWCVARDLSGCTPDTALIDRLLDERAATAVGQRTNWSTTATMAERLADCS